jgi:hypothetical protein
VSADRRGEVSAWGRFVVGALGYRLPTVGPILCRKMAVPAEIEDRKSFRASHLHSFPPISANRATVQENNPVDLNLLQVMQVTGKDEFYIRLGLMEDLVQIRGVVR